MRDTGKLPVVSANDLRILCHTIAHWCGRDGEVWRVQSLAMLDQCAVIGYELAMMLDQCAVIGYAR